MIETATVLGVILAGGKSKRMGTDKANLCIDGQSMLVRNQLLLQSIGINNILVCRNKAEYLSDIHPDCGPMGAIHSALNYAQKNNKYQSLIIIPIDMPLLNKPLLQALMNTQGSCSAQYYQDTPLPLFLPYHSSYVALSETVATSPINRSIKAFLGLIDSEYLIYEQSERLINTNSKEQWRQAVNTLLANKKE
ncbi:molybdenum cofactor guanylyltransferase [Shewanella surugensis]|uniref:Molybdenum cofactor guanylyltransferase n=1 Tax=Shewanella surugensis TaxID=212020 RepID=A0ABT0LBK6_9GAMM|nr:molybdenum cofactor guanylyltransferase [Shewanella surugensis]MCL1125088.1 molybdenum cofactor guanylyltransferase [Shewanella surugensis]